MALLALYDLSSPYFSSTKQRAWILTGFTSAVMTLLSLPFLYDFVAGNASVLYVHSRGALDVYALRFFQSYLISDLILGALSYPDQVDLLSGWIHHSVYILIVEVAIYREWTHIFSLASIMELPTLVMSIGKLWPKFKSTVLFATTFFLTRIFFHATLAASYSLSHNGASVSHSKIPAAILSVLLLLHVFWFSQCIQGFIRRANIPLASPDLKPSEPAIPLRAVPELVGARQLLARSSLWRRRRIHRRMVYDKARRLLPAAGVAQFTKFYDMLPGRQTLYDAVGLGGRESEMTN
ncbi:hypothetical protein DL96DRAFT_1553219 [Flagelloscypha sp. PMI_526]|nr:hypothetical protein DL96DRAFT_1553219 [Flagelloscypha sp. PMI_526]